MIPDATRDESLDACDASEISDEDDLSDLDTGEYFDTAMNAHKDLEATCKPWSGTVSKLWCPDSDLHADVRSVSQDVTSQLQQGSNSNTRNETELIEPQTLKDPIAFMDQLVAGENPAENPKLKLFKPYNKQKGTDKQHIKTF